MKRTKWTTTIGYSQVDYISETDCGEKFDTKVIVNDQLLCVIEGNKINAFNEKLRMLVERYRI